MGLRAQSASRSDGERGQAVFGVSCMGIAKLFVFNRARPVLGNVFRSSGEKILRVIHILITAYN